jgi:hypothetical protein
MGDQSRGVHIPGMDATDGWRTADTTSGSGKGKEKIAPFRSTSKAGPWSPSSDAEASSEVITPL